MKFSSTLPLLSLITTAIAFKEDDALHEENNRGFLANGLCRSYIGGTIPEHEKEVQDVATFCTPKCGDQTSSCLGEWGGDHSLLNQDPDGDDFIVGTCNCSQGLADLGNEIFDQVAKALLATGDALSGLCTALLDIFTLAIDAVEALIPEGKALGESMELAIEAAKTFAQNGLSALDLQGATQNACGSSPTAQQVQDVFDFLSSLSRPDVPGGLGCLKASCS
ncbi:hypothetical protein F5Y15DRAFT_326226 [Xylariaceae sp. FL0016]|nr:hypothetical protein F5Y15DRAFT_326226 [Xylariaceae sp. FL0016]